MILAIDAMGSDKGPSVFIEPVKRFVRDYDAKIRVYGDKEALAALEGIENVTVVPTTEVMEMDDGPLAVRRKKDSSMVRAVTDLKEGLADGVVSAGSTGALLSAGSLLVKTAEPVERAGILCMIPTKTGEPFALLDTGANASCTAEQMLNFAVIGKAYMKAVRGVIDPRIGLLNIGKEAHKGDETHQEAYRLLKEAENLNFAGNVEPNKVFSGKYDVVIADGFSGNVLEKAIEGTASFLMGSIQDALMNSGFLTKIGALIIKGAVKKVKGLLDPNQYGGALIAGLNKPIIKAHGNSKEEAVYNAILQLYRVVREDVTEKVKEELR